VEVNVDVAFLVLVEDGGIVGAYDPVGVQLFDHLVVGLGAVGIGVISDEHEDAIIISAHLCTRPPLAALAFPSS
jgi:hypothetical protein